MSEDLGESVVTTGSAILTLNHSTKTNVESIKEVLCSGKAYEKFLEMVAAQRWRYKLP